MNDFDFIEFLQLGIVLSLNFGLFAFLGFVLGDIQLSLEPKELEDAE